MIQHYLKIAFRNMRKYKTQSFSGIFVLAFGLACFVPAVYWLRYETTYDNFYPDAEHVYRVYTVEKQSGKVNELVSGILERKLHEQFAATENSTVLFIQPNDCKTEETPRIRLRTVFTDSTFLKVFPQVIVSGDAQQPLEIVNNIVLTESVAIRLFGNVEKAIGQQIKSTLYPKWAPGTVTAVVKDPPPNTNLSFDAIFNFEQIKQQKVFVERSVEQIWALASLQMYIKFHPQTDVDGLAEQLRDFPARLDANANRELRLLPVSDIRHQQNAEVPFTLNFIRLFFAAGLLLILSALFNFLNLLLDHFRQRIPELRQRTVHGAKSRQLIAQMMLETVYSIFPALLLAWCFVVTTRPVFSGLFGIEIQMTQLFNQFVVCGAGVMILMPFIGFFPFWRLSRLAMQRRSKIKISAGQPVLRRMAVTFQLAVSVIFIIATSVVMIQMRFVNHKELGFDSTGIIRLSGLPSVNKAVLNNVLSAIPQIESITNTHFEPQHDAQTYNSELKNMTTNVEWAGKLQSENPVFQLILSDSRFAETFKLKILMGKWLDDVGENTVVLNEEAVRVMRLSEPVGAIIRIPSYNNPMQEFTVTGVVNDFHVQSLRSRIHPTIFFSSTYPSKNVYIRVVPGQELEAMKRIKAVLTEINASFAADVVLTPLDELYARLNYSEQAGLKLFSVLATVCLLISLFGIYAVATASTLRRRKEIAVRKVFGASANDIVRIFFRDL